MEIDDEGPQAALSIETIPYVVKIRIQTASSRFAQERYCIQPRPLLTNMYLSD